MKSWMKVFAVTVLVAAPAMILGPVIWPPADVGPEPTGASCPSSSSSHLMESILLGLGISFLAFGLPVVRRISADSKFRAWAMYLSIGWLMVSWWPHDNLHMHTGIDLQKLLYIEYGFHVTLMVCAIVLAYCFLSLVNRGSLRAVRPNHSRMQGGNAVARIKSAEPRRLARRSTCQSRQTTRSN